MRLPSSPNSAYAIDSIQRGLQFISLRFKRFVIYVRGNIDWWRNLQARARKRQWHLKPVPASFSFPEFSRGDREWKNWLTRFLGEQHRSHLRYVSWTFGTVDSEP